MHIPTFLSFRTTRRDTGASKGSVAKVSQNSSTRTILFPNPLVDQYELSHPDRGSENEIVNPVDHAVNQTSMDEDAHLAASWLNTDIEDDNGDSWTITRAEDYDDDCDLLSLDDESSSFVSTDIEGPSNLTQSGFSTPTTSFAIRSEASVCIADVFLAGLPVLPVQSLPPAVRHCRVCSYSYLTDGPISEYPVGLPCRHVLGHLCVQKLLSIDGAQPIIACPLCHA